MSVYGLTQVTTIAQRDGLPQTPDMLVYVSEKETCYKLVGSVWVTHFTGGAVPIEFGLDPVIGLPGGGSGGNGGNGGAPVSITYSNSNPTPTTIGGITAGSTFNSVTIQDMFTNLLYAYQPPVFTAFAISTVPTTREVGQPVAAGTYNFTWTVTNSANITPDSVLIADQTQGLSLKTGADIVSPESITISSVVKTAAQTNTWRISAVSVTNTTFTRDFTVSWRWGIMHGESALTSLTGADVQTLRAKTIAATNTGIFNFLAGNYKYISYPTAMGLKSVFKDTSTNLDVAMEPPYIVTSTNAFGVTTDYYVHRTTNTLGGAININIIS